MERPVLNVDWNWLVKVVFPIVVGIILTGFWGWLTNMNADLAKLKLDFSNHTSAQAVTDLNTTKALDSINGKLDRLIERNQ